MHIVHCLTHSVVGGGQVVPHLLIRRFLQYYPEIRHTVMLPSDGVFVRKFKDLNVDVVTFPFDRIRIGNLSEIKRIIGRINPDVIHSHGKGAGLYTRRLNFSGKNILTVHSHHGFHLPKNFFSRQVFLALEKKLMLTTDAVVAVSQSEADEITKYIPSGSKIKIIGNVVDKNEIAARASAAAGSHFREAGKNKFSVLMIGRNDPVKNYALAFSAAEIVLKTSRDFYFIFVGLLPESEQAKKLLDEYTGNVQFTGESENPLTILAQSSVLLMTSKREGSPLSVLEAFALKKPVVGTNVRGIKDLVTDHQTGLLTELNPESVAQGIISLAKDKALYETLSHNAVQMIDSLNLQQWTEDYFKVYKSNL
jgi:glycosyltransferase involved in cell wall biosynthesis